MRFSTWDAPSKGTDVLLIQCEVITQRWRETEPGGRDKSEGLCRGGGIRRRSCGNALPAKNIPDRAGAKAQRWKGGENGRETGKYFNTRSGKCLFCAGEWRLKNVWPQIPVLGISKNSESGPKVQTLGYKVTNSGNIVYSMGTVVHTVLYI